jgi:hypothetical protein
MPVVTSDLRELNLRLKAQLASNQFGNAQNHRADLRALGTLVTNFIERVDATEQAGQPDPPVVQPRGTNLDLETDQEEDDGGR